MERITEKKVEYYCGVVSSYLKKPVKLLSQNGVHCAVIPGKHGSVDYTLTCFGTTREVYYCLVSICNALYVAGREN